MNGLEIHSPATIFDMAEFGGAKTAMHWAILKEMHTAGHTWFVSRDGNPLGLFGVYPAGEGMGEAWFNARPAAQKGMLRLMRAIRLTLQDLPYREIVTICGTPEGARMASVIGFSRSGNCDIGEIWTWTHSQAAAAVAHSSNRPNSSSAAVSQSWQSSRAR